MAKKLGKTINTNAMKVTIYFGCLLFGISIIAFIVGFLPWLQVPGGAAFGDSNLIILTSFVASAVIPPLVGYFVGDRSTRGKSKLVHYYNGMLFAMLGFWLTTLFQTLSGLFGWIGFVDSPVSYAVINTLPAIFAVATLIILGGFYARHTRHQRTLDDYLPFRVLFAASFISLFAAASLSIAVDSWNGQLLLSSIAALFLPVVMIGGLVAFGAWLLGPGLGSLGRRFTISLIVASYAIVLVTFVGQVLFMIDQQGQQVAPWSFGIGILTWATFIYLMRRSATPAKSVK